MTVTATDRSATNELFAGTWVIDVDTHITEPHDLWTSRAPEAYKERVPLVVDVDGVPMWSVDGVELGRASSSSVVYKDGSKYRGAAFTKWTINDAHPSAYDVDA